MRRLFACRLLVVMTALAVGEAAVPAGEPETPPAEKTSGKRFSGPAGRAEFLKLFHRKLAGEGPAKRFDSVLSFDKSEQKDGYTLHTVSYFVDDDEKISAYLLVPDHPKGKKLPLVFCPHPTNRIGKDVLINRYPAPPANEAEQRKRENRANALELVRRGFVCFVPDRGGYGERSPLPEEPNPFKNMHAYQEKLQKKYPDWGYTRGKVPYDLSCALDALLKLDFIDGENVGTIGHSLGGWDSLHFWGSDPRVKAAVINSGGSYEIDPELWTDDGWMEKFAAGDTLGMSNILRSAQGYILLGAPRPLLYMKSTEEGKTPSSIMENLKVIRAGYAAVPAGRYKVAGKSQFSAFFHNDGHDFPSFARELAYRWLERQLQGKY